MSPKENETNPFFKINYIFYDKLIINPRNLNEKCFYELIELLRPSELLKTESSKLIKKWKDLTSFVICYFALLY